MDTVEVDAVVVARDGRIFIDDVSYDAPPGVGRAINGGRAVNGWRLWARS